MGENWEDGRFCRGLRDFIQKSCRKQQEAGGKRRGLLRRDSPLKNVAKGVKTTPFYLTFAKIQA